MVDHDSADFLQSRLLHDSSDTGKALAHDGDKQVEEDQLHDNCGQNEHDPDDPRVMLRVIVLAKFTEASEVGVDNSVNRWDADRIFEDRGLTVFDTVRVQDEDDVGEGADCDEKHDEEHLNVLDDLGNHSDESAEWLEQTHPVEHLDPQEQDSD